MAKKKHSKQPPIDGKFVPVLNDELDSDAFISLAGNASKLFTYMKRACRTVAYNMGGLREGDVVFDYTYTEAEKIGFSNKTFNRAVKELWNKGFIGVIKIGGRTFSVHGGRCNSKYKMTAYWKTYGSGGSGRWIDRTKFEPNPWAVKSEP